MKRKQELHLAVNLINFKGDLKEHTKNGHVSGLMRFPKEAWEPEDEGNAPKIDIHGPNVLKKYVPIKMKYESIESDKLSFDISLDGQVKRLKTSMSSDNGSIHKKKRQGSHFKK